MACCLKEREPLRHSDVIDREAYVRSNGAEIMPYASAKLQYQTVPSGGLCS